jgi:hypothetical protein
MKEEVLLKVISIIRNLREDGIVSSGAPTNNASGENIAGLPPDNPPVDLRKKKYKGIPFFYKNIFRRKKNV